MSPRHLIALVLAAFLQVSPAAAQRLGQWWWAGELGGSGRILENRVRGRTVAESDQTDLLVSFDLNGYLLNPRVGRFRLGLDGRFANISGTRSLDTDRTGYRGELSLFPRGPFPLSIYLRRQQYEYSGLGAEDALTLLGAPESTTGYGGRLAIRRGLLRGSELSYKRSDLEFMDSGAETEIREDGVFDWTGQSGAISHHLRAERRLREFGIVDFATEDLTLTLEERGDLAPSWNLNLAAFAVRREVRSIRTHREVETLRVRSTVTHPIRERNTLRLSFSAGQVEFDGAASRSHSLSARYLWRRGRWQAGPFAAFTRQRSGGLRQEAPQLGLTAGWSWSGRQTDLHLFGSGSYLRLEPVGESPQASRSATALSAQATLGRGQVRRMRSELEVAAARNELQVGGEPLSALPDLGVRAARGGVSDSLRGRVTMKKSWQSARFSIYGELSRRESSRDGIGEPGFTARTSTVNAQFERSPISILASAGETRLGGPLETDQSARFTTLTAYWQPLWFLRLRGFYRGNSRQVTLGPDFDGDTAELEIELQYGQVVVELIFFETRLASDSAPGRSHHGVRWLVTRRFGGWLPIVSAPQRRGVIR